MLSGQCLTGEFTCISFSEPRPISCVTIRMCVPLLVRPSVHMSLRGCGRSSMCLCPTKDPTSLLLHVTAVVESINHGAYSVKVKEARLLLQTSDLGALIDLSNLTNAQLWTKTVV